MTPQGDLCIIGNGPLAECIAEAATLGGWRYAGCWSDPTSEAPLQWLGKLQDLREVLREWEKSQFIVADVTPNREKIIEIWSPWLKWASVVHPHASVSPSAIIGAGSFIGAGAIVGTRSTIAPHAIIEAGRNVGHHTDTMY